MELRLKSPFFRLKRIFEGYYPKMRGKGNLLDY